MTTALDSILVPFEARNGDVRIRGVSAGEGPVVVLLHGFPEFWYGWRHQLPALAAAGYRAVAPDLRGYGLSDKPTSLRAYAGQELTGDVAAVIRACGVDSATVVGHDWGGAIAWLTAMSHADVVDRLVILNAPHPAVFAAALRSPGQALRSSYMGFFNVPIVPELALRAGRFALLRWALTAATVNPTSFTEEDLDRYVEAWSEPGALTTMLALYRAMGRTMARQLPTRRVPTRGRRIDAPTMVIWGTRDPVLPPSLADPGRDRVPDLRLHLVETSGHFVAAEAPDTVNDHLLAFLAE